MAFYQYLEGKRRIRSYGLLHGVETDEGAVVVLCEHCGGNQWVSEEGLEWLSKRAEEVSVRERGG